MNASREAPQGQRHERIAAMIPDQDVRGYPTDSRPPTDNIVAGDISLGQKMLSAVLGSILTSLLVTPLDVVRVRLQSQQSAPSFSEHRTNPNVHIPRSFSKLPSNLGVTACCREVFWISNTAQYCIAETSIASNATNGFNEASAIDCAAEQSQRKTFTSTLDGMRKIVRYEGFTTLWRGLSPTLVMAVPGNVIYFAGYDWLRTSSRSPLVGRVDDKYAPLVAGSTARVIAAFFVSPIELFRTRMQASRASSAAQNLAETTAGVKEMVSNSGLQSLWRGLNLTLWRDVPFSAFYWWGYEFTRGVLLDIRDHSKGNQPSSNGLMSRGKSDQRNMQNTTSTLIDSFTAGAVSGGVASIITTPFDVGKTRQQVFQLSTDTKVGIGQAEMALRPEQYSMPRFLLHIFREEGVGGLFKGWAPRMMKVAPACAIMISSYELGKKFAQRRINEEE